MAIIIATCNDIVEFGSDALAAREWSSRFLGTGWVTELYARADALGWIIASGDVALAKVRSGVWAASDVLVIQELGSRQGSRLIGAGASPLLLTCMESPLYAPLFYDRLSTWIEAFPYAMVPSTPAQQFRSVQRVARLRFPCFWDDEVLPIRPWRERKDVMLLAGNKYWSRRPPLPLWRPQRLLSAFRHEARLALSPTRKTASEIQLHDDRLACVASLSQRGLLDIYGAGWTDLSHLPSSWQRRLADANLRVFGAVGGKIALQSDYRFVLCAENARYPGYVTEKIIQCFVSGTIPIYLGAPDIGDFAPAEAFIDARTLPSLASLPDYLLGIDESTAHRMLKAGRDFLFSPAGRIHAYAGFADWVVAIVEEWRSGHRS